MSLGTRDFKDYEIKKIVKIQALARGMMARKKYAIRHLDEKSQTDYWAFFTGNDPVIANLKSHQAEEGNTALIATSGMRAVLIACELAGNTNKIPKIILVDNSKLVYSLWREIRKYISTCNNADDFFKGLSEFLDSYQNLYRPCDSNQEIKEYFKSLFQNYGYNRVKSIIMATSFIRQCWSHENTFKALKNILSKLNIQNVYVYPSNIVHCVEDNMVDRILRNIHLIHPKLSIHTNYCPVHGVPEEVFLCQDSKPDVVSNTIFPKGEDSSLSSSMMASFLINGHSVSMDFKMFIAMAPLLSSRIDGGKVTIHEVNMQQTDAKHEPKKKTRSLFSTSQPKILTAACQSTLVEHKNNDDKISTTKKYQAKLEGILDKYRKHKFKQHSGRKLLLEEKEGKIFNYNFPKSGYELFLEIHEIVKKKITDDIYKNIITKVYDKLHHKTEKRDGFLGWRMRDQDTANFHKEILDYIKDDLAAFGCASTTTITMSAF